ncbi:hypothetical protein ACFQY4_36245 [Catellatospora bangladeshensis]|uniref:Leucine rich repeat variant n=1 Tax=Catellatospora bangladeshensis TaxID=310355 RepID=A0A8J3JNF9_9ACTN|nr:hypothetical protein [Catellatospora bangladeshensis]GIF81079.1 hypothetical protein Cba03nite_24280 [Catellatospora bangladeshensis]
MPETGDWPEPQMVHTGCCEGSRWRLRLPGPSSDRGQVRLAGLALNPSAPDDVLVALVRAGGRLPRLVLAEHFRYHTWLCEERPEVAAALVTVTTETGDPHLLERLKLVAAFPPDAIAALAVSPDYRVRAAVPWITGCPPETMAALAADPHPEVRRNTVWVDQLSPEIQIVLARDPDRAVRDAVSQRDALPAEARDILARDEDVEIRANVLDATDGGLTGEVAEEMARHPDPDVRVWAAGTEPLSLETRWVLAGDPVPAVRQAVGLSGYTPGPVLATLADDADQEVRRRVALHGATPPESLQALAMDPDEEVARTAVTAISGKRHRPLPAFERLAASAGRLSVKQLRDLLGATVKSGCEPGPRPWPVEEAPDLRQALMARCAVSPDARLRAMAAADWWLPAETAAQLVSDRDPMVRRWLARHCRDKEILIRLAEAPDEGVGEALADNGYTPADVLEGLPAKPLRLARHRNASGSLLARLLVDADHATRIAIAENRNTPPTTLAGLALGDTERDVIHAACANAALPVETMWELVQAVRPPEPADGIHGGIIRQG